MIDLSHLEDIFNSLSGISDVSCAKQEKSIIVSFNFDAKVSVNGANFFTDYDLQIEIPNDYPNKLPIVYEVGEKKVINYPHINPDKNQTFCLGTEIDLRRKLKPDYSFKKYISIIADFLGIYEYYCKFEIFPYGERQHGKMGILDTYKELFDVKTDRQALNLMQITKLKNKYRNKKCPCNSGLKIKNCHWDSLQSILSNPLERKQMIKDLILLAGG